MVRSRVARTPRQKAFAVALRHWRPSVGERVYVRRRAGSISQCCACGVVVGEAIVSEWYRVRLETAACSCELVVSLEDLRPS